MQYRSDKNNAQISILGYGCMRLPSGRSGIDLDKSEKLLMHAVESGVNYFDTAYLYTGNEEAVGEIFSRNNARQKVFLATKLPHSMCNSYADFDKYFMEELKRLQTDYIDYYLIHNVSSVQQWQKLQEMNIEGWIAEKKKSGVIRNIGFSYHGSKNDFPIIIDSYSWDFVQIQYNYLNINYQAGESGLKYAAAGGLPVFIMEPLLGGRLVNNLPNDVERIIREQGKTPVEMALGWLWNQPEVTMVLSGMADIKQVEENLRLAEEFTPWSGTEDSGEIIEQVIAEFDKSYKIRCTGCNYCMPCPKNINIPGCFSAYNASYSLDKMSGFTQYLNTAGAIGENPRFASDCVACGKCEKHCPQNIEIRKELKRVKRRLELPFMHTVVKIGRKLLGR